MTYKVVCNKCGKSVKIVAKGSDWYAYCKCMSWCLNDIRPDFWKVEASGVIPVDERKKLCVGCYDSHYNLPGQSNTGECWLLKTAKVVMKKKVGINDVPPWNHAPIKCLSCYHEIGFVMVDAKRTY